MDRTDRRDDEPAGATGEAGEDPIGDDEPAGTTGGDDRSVLHVASEGADWRFSLDDLDDDRGVEPLTPGSPEPEHVAFVLFGAALTLFVVSRFLV